MRVLEARQLGLKYIANVTYGYTSATFSGRMPAVEIADAIVQSGRETLEKVGVITTTTHNCRIAGFPAGH
jgi:DNA polymerase zeta